MAGKIYSPVNPQGITYIITSKGLIRSKRSSPPQSSSLSESTSASKMRPFRTDIRNIRDFRDFYEYGRRRPSLFDESWLPHDPQLHFLQAFPSSTRHPELQHSGRPMSVSSEYGEVPRNIVHEENCQHASGTARRGRTQRHRNAATPQPQSPNPMPLEISPAVASENAGISFNHRSSLSPRIPFSTAAKQLETTLRRAIFYFSKFHSKFRETSDELKFHANNDLLNAIWRSQVEGSKRKPGLAYFETIPWAGNQGVGRSVQNNYDRRQGDSNQSAAEELHSFVDHQQQVITRFEQLRALGMLPDSPPQSQCSRSSQRSNHYTEDGTNLEMKLYHARTLKHKINSCYPHLHHLIEDMGQDYIHAKSAIRELKAIRDWLMTSRMAWDETWTENGGVDSDDEVIQRS